MSNLVFSILLIVVGIMILIFHNKLFEMQKESTIPIKERRFRAILFGIAFVLGGLFILLTGV